MKFSSTPLRICSNQEMRQLDLIAEQELGIGPAILMENAGRAATELVMSQFPDSGIDQEILVFAGKGNNAGDAFVIARQLLGLGRRVRVFHLVKGQDYKGATRENFEILRKMKAKLIQIEQVQELDAFFEQARGPHLAIDGLIGTGLKGNLEGHFYEVVESINRHVDHIVSLDVPTGVSGDTGQVLGIAIEASMTIAFGFPRLGHFLPPGAGYCGKLANVDISLPAPFKNEGDKFLLRAKTVASKIVRRDRYAHKNTFGHVFLVGGSLGRTGAIAMATQAALRTGVGLATVGTWSDVLPLVAHQLPVEAMTVPIPQGENSFEKYAEQVKYFSSVVVGPGMGSRPESKVLLEVLLQHYNGPVVIDADALNLIAEYEMHDLCLHRKAPTILTPHPGEMARLLKWKKEDVVNDPVGALRECIRKTHAVVMLKGAATLMSSPDDILFVNHFPNPGMATAGSGDVLAGMIGALVAQGIPAFDALQVGVYLHSLAGRRAAETISPRGMLASDIIAEIPMAYEELKKKYDEEEAPSMAKLL